MGELLEALILGIVQGLTEFLPVSSSGHLEIFKFILGDNSTAEESLLTTVFLHFATALATVFLFHREVKALLLAPFKKDDTANRKLILFIIVSMIPAALTGVFLEEHINTLFSQNLLLVGVCLLVTAFLLLVSEIIHEGGKKLNLIRALIIGLSQAIAILPGISRSGATISTSLLMGLDKEDAARFSFLMVVPLIFGKIAKDLISGDFSADMPSIEYLAVGFLASFFTGLWACRFMVKLVKASRLHWFSIYCIIAGIFAIGASIAY